MELRGIPLIGDDFDLSNYEYAILVKNVNRRGIQRFYGDPLKDLGLDTSKVFCFELYYQAEGRTPAADKREYLDQFLPILKENNFKHLLVADSEYFKLLSRERNSTGFYGETVPSKYPEYENTFTLTPIVNYTQGEYNSQALETIGLSCLAYCNNLGLYDSTGMLGDIILKDELYPDNLKDIEIFLDTLHLYPFISSDIETYSLVTKDAGLGTIGFAWDVLSGGSFSVEFNRVSDYSDKVKELLRSFFDQYRGKIYFHNAAFDVTKLIYQLYMKDSTDIRGMREGIRVFSNMVEDTQLIAYNCLNSTVKPDLSLKTLSKPFLGNYAEDVTDITLIPEKVLLTYNLKDCLGTLYVKNIYEPQMIKETAGRYYYEISKPSLEFIWEMQLVGLPIDLNRVKALEAPVRSSREQIQSYFDNLPPVKKTTVIHAIRKAEKTNASLVNKHHPFQAFMKQFNPGSNNQISTLLYDVLKLPVLNLTDTGNPSTNQDTIKQLLEEEHYKNELEKEILENLQEYTSSGTLMSTFIPGFLTKSWNRGGTDWVTSNYNLSGIVTGRISSSDMNLANLPSNSKFGNAVKYCFRAPKGWLLGGADFSALEEKVNAIRTNDPNRIAVYTDGYDGHSLRAFNYFKDQMPDIEEMFRNASSLKEKAKAINSIQETYPSLREASKAVTFRFNYGGGWKGLAEKGQFTPEEAKIIEEGYLEMYKVTHQYKMFLLHQATAKGYLDVAFGLRVRTPLIYGKNAKYLFGLEAGEARTAYNADSQSFAALTNRALIDFKQRLLKEPRELQESVLLLNSIYDAIYILMKEDPDVVAWVNTNLVEAMSWQGEGLESPVKISAELEIGKDWYNLTELPHNIKADEIELILPNLSDKSPKGFTL